jgi:hypothetical protein
MQVHITNLNITKGLISETQKTNQISTSQNVLHRRTPWSLNHYITLVQMVQVKM